MNPESNPSAELGQFISALSFADLGKEAVRYIERCFIDTVGVTLAGSTADPSRKARAIMTNSNDDGEATLIGTGTTASTSDAAFFNGIASHALDFDDVSWAMDGHPSAPLVTAILTISEVSDISGKEAIAAYMAGFETMCYLSAPISPSHYKIGWHATSTFGTFGAAAAAASVLGLSAEETRQGLNIAASLPAGLKRNFGSMTKPMHVGHATRSGVTAALLAADGFTADSRAVGGERGFLELYGGTEDFQYGDFPQLNDIQGLTESGVHIKKYPCCYFTHTSIDATIDIVKENDISPIGISQIETVVSRGAVDALPHEDPSTALEAKFSMPYTVAYAAVNRSLGLEAFEHSALKDQQVRRVQKHVSLRSDNDLPYDEHAATVCLSTGDNEYKRTLTDPPGSHDNPLNDEELHQKFTSCASTVMEESKVEVVLNRLDGFRTESSVADLVAKL